MKKIKQTHTPHARTHTQKHPNEAIYDIKAKTRTEFAAVGVSSNVTLSQALTQREGMREQLLATYKELHFNTFFAAI